MAKTREPRAPRASAAEPTEVEVRYDLPSLPTAFHKAGLAGLVLLVGSLKARQVLTDAEAACSVTATGVTVTFTEVLLGKLMDDLYDARTVEVAVKAKWPGADIKREETVEEEVNGKTTRTKRFIYDQVQPKGAFFDNVFDGGKEIWRKLWRDMLWNIPRGRPTTREPFNQRAAGESCKEGPNGWAELVKVHRARAKSGYHTAALSSALFPGAQAVNAEAVPFEGRAEENLLLHFWPLTALLFVPQEIERDGATNLPPSSFTVAVPDVSDLKEFVTDYPRWLADRSPEPRGYRPAQAVIDLPAEGALAFLEDLAVLTKLNVEEGELRFSIGAVEYLHLVKEGNNVKLMAAGRVAPGRKLLSGYRAIVCPTGSAPRYRNSLFRRNLLVALLADEPWHRPFGSALQTFDAGVFIRQPRKDDEKGPPQFANDAYEKFRHEARLLSGKLERYNNMPEPDRADLPRPKPEPAVIINRVVRGYLLARAQDRSGIKLDSFSADAEAVDWSKVPGEFNDAKRKLAESLFLEFRSRREQAFVDHFAATFFSVTQRLNTSDRLELAQLLTDGTRRDDLKTLTLLALSANS